MLADVTGVPAMCRAERRLCFANAKHNRSRKPPLSEAEGDPVHADAVRNSARHPHPACYMVSFFKTSAQFPSTFGHYSASFQRIASARSRPETSTRWDE